MSTWFLVKGLEDNRIVAVKVTKESPAYLTIQQIGFDGKVFPTRTTKRSTWDNFFPTFALAKKFALDRTRGEIEHVETQLVNLRNKLESIEAMQEPEL